MLDGFAQLFLKVVGEVQVNANNYFDFLRENFAKVAFRSIISTGIVCNEYCILFR